MQRPTQAPTVSPALTPDVQAPVVGIPDPLRPLALPRPKRPDRDDPYGQLGIRSGGLMFYPAIQQDFGYDTNPNRLPSSPEGSWVSRTEGALRLQSDWLVHELTADLRGAYSVYPDVPSADRPEGSGRVGLRLDATRDTSINLEGRFLVETQRPGSPELNAAVGERPLYGTYGASAGVMQRFNRLELGLKGTIDHAFFEDARLANGTILSQADREFTQYGVQARAAYELTPGVKPFIEGLADTREYDQTIDSAGFRRSSKAIGARLGSTFELTRLITGE
ncbi:MAG TPA: outer membrane beta-barrel protein, partial [Beijerinckiaceae bacterium]|nr:outer membrane beta-barrel protein [Beijerinckiaceae bacterium]